ncbi:MAG: hypothetical protein WBC61_09565, partial [Dehalococcoidia bacterium]
MTKRVSEAGCSRQAAYKNAARLGRSLELLETHPDLEAVLQENQRPANQHHADYHTAGDRAMRTPRPRRHAMPGDGPRKPSRSTNESSRLASGAAQVTFNVAPSPLSTSPVGSAGMSSDCNTA